MSLCARYLIKSNIKWKYKHNIHFLSSYLHYDIKLWHSPPPYYITTFTIPISNYDIPHPQCKIGYSPKKSVSSWSKVQDWPHIWWSRVGMKLTNSPKQNICQMEGFEDCSLWSARSHLMDGWLRKAHLLSNCKYLSNICTNLSQIDVLHIAQHYQNSFKIFENFFKRYW